jgi:hypothetical protein
MEGLPLLTSLTVCMLAAALGDAPAQLPDGKHLFIDDALVAESSGVTWEMTVPEKIGRPLLQADEPWELENLMMFGYANSVVKDGDLYRMWYEVAVANAERRPAYATSRDGINWDKPHLGIVEFAGTRENNLVEVTGHPDIDQWQRGPCVFIDPTAPADARYKMSFRLGATMYSAESADGLRFRIVCDSVATGGNLDSANISFYDTRLGKYLAYTRWRSKHDGVNLREVARTESDRWDGGWSPRVPVIAPDERDPKGRDLYTPGVCQYAPDVYLAAMAVFDHGKNHPRYGRVHAQLATSRDGLTWRRADRRPFIANGPEGSFDSGQIYPGVPAVPIGDDVFIYYYGTAALHIRDAERPDPGFISAVKLRRDRFVSASAGGEGVLVTKSFVCPAGELTLNVEAQGEVRVAVLDASGKPVPGMGLDDCAPISGDHLAAPVRWRGGSDLGTLKRRPIALRFALGDAKVFAFAFAATP